MKKSLGILFFMSAAGIAQEKPQAFRDWFFERKNLGADIGDACLAYTDKKVDQNTWRLNIVYPSAKTLPTLVVITQQDATIDPKTIYSQTDSSRDIQKHYRSDFLDATFPSKSYWFAPSSFANFFSYIRRGSALKVKYLQETEKQFYFSLMGSTAATNKIAELCNNKKDFVPEAFYNYVDKLNITALPTSTDASTLGAWDSINSSWDYYLEASKHQVSLADLQKKIDPLVAKEKEYLKQAGLLTKEIENQEIAKADLQNLVVSQKAQLKKAQEDLALQDQKLQSALIVLKDKEDIFRPVREESRPYFSAVDTAKQRVSSLNSQVASTQEQIRQIKIKIANLWDEVELTEARIRTLQQQLSQLKTDRIRANNAYLSFNVESELQRKLNSDFFYQQRLRAKDDSDREVIRKRDQLAREEAKLRDFERDLRNCQSDPTRDCSQFQQQVSSQQGVVNQAEQNYNSEVSNNRQLDREIATRKNQLRTETENEKQALANKVEELDIKISQHESAISQNEFKLNTLRNSDIPRAERDLSTAQNTLNSQQIQLDTAKDSLRRAEQDLASFKSRTDYDRKEREYLTADRDVQNIRNTMASLDLQIKTLQTSIAKNESRIQAITANIEKLIANLASTQTELQSTQAALAPLYKEKELLNSQLAAAQNSMREHAEDFRVSIRDIPALKHLVPKFPLKFQDWL